jgi:Putative MetA-pathway of phenol degradation
MKRGCPSIWRAVWFLMLLLPAAPGFGAHPLITEDTGTQGQGNWQLELTAEYGHEEVAGTEDDSGDFAAVLAYGLRDNLDLMLTLPYSHIESETGGATTTTNGLGDIGLDAKWRFFEEGGLSVALKAGVIFPSGDEAEGLGAGNTNFNANLISSYETGPWGYHLHLAYFSNRNVHDEREAILHGSLALTYLAMENLRLVADLGNYTTADRAYDEDTRFLTLGGIYGVNDDFDIDIGLRHGLSEPETDTTLLLGIALRF